MTVCGLRKQGGCGLPGFIVREYPDFSELSVKSLLHNHLPVSHSRDGLGQLRESRVVDLPGGMVEKNVQFGAQGCHDFMQEGFHLAAGGSGSR